MEGFSSWGVLVSQWYGQGLTIGRQSAKVRCIVQISALEEGLLACANIEDTEESSSSSKKQSISV